MLRSNIDANVSFTPLTIPPPLIPPLKGAGNTVSTKAGISKILKKFLNT